MKKNKKYPIRGVGLTAIFISEKGMKHSVHSSSVCERMANVGDMFEFFNNITRKFEIDKIASIHKFIRKQSGGLTKKIKK